MLEVLRTAPRAVLITTGLRLSQIALYTLMTTYGLTYVAAKLTKTSSAGLIAVVTVSALGLVTTPLWAVVSDRVGRRRPYLFGAVGGTVGLVLFFLAVDTGSTLLIVLAMVIAINLVHDAMYGPQAAWRGPVAVGSPVEVADEMERWVDETGADGFNLAYAVTPGTFEQVATLVVPELRRRGRMPARPVEGTLRDVLGGGGPRVGDDHPAAVHRAR